MVSLSCCVSFAQGFPLLFTTVGWSDFFLLKRTRHLTKGHGYDFKSPNPKYGARRRMRVKVFFLQKLPGGINNIFFLHKVPHYYSPPLPLLLTLYIYYIGLCVQYMVIYPPINPQTCAEPAIINQSAVFFRSFEWNCAREGFAGIPIPPKDSLPHASRASIFCIADIGGG